MTDNKPKLLGNIYGEQFSTGFAGNVWDSENTSPALMTMAGGNRQPLLPDSNLRIRKLTPKECFRLMGVKDAEFERVRQHQSDSTLYHLAGDSIVTTVLMAIFGELLGVEWKEKVDKLHGQ